MSAHINSFSIKVLIWDCLEKESGGFRARTCQAEEDGYGQCEIETEHPGYVPV